MHNSQDGRGIYAQRKILRGSWTTLYAMRCLEQSSKNLWRIEIANLLTNRAQRNPSLQYIQIFQADSGNLPYTIRISIKILS